MVDENNISFRIPTPVFGAGLIESISEDTIIANQAAQAAVGRFLGISGHTQPQRKRRLDHTVRLEGAKQIPADVLGGSLQRGNGHHERDSSRTSADIPRHPLPPGCLINPTPEDTTNFDVTSTVSGPSDIVAFSNFMRFLDQPAPSCTGTGCSAIDSERQEPIHQRREMLRLPHSEHDDGHVLRHRAQQCPGQSIL